MPAAFETLNDNIVRFSASMTMEDLRNELGAGREPLVEPLSAKKPFSRFMAEGGLGYGSLNEGSFASSVCRVRTDKMVYGSDCQTLYNVGYPLHRLTEGTPGRFACDTGEVTAMTIYTRESIERAAEFQACEEPIAAAPDLALDALYVNAAAAEAMQLPGAGAVAIYRADEAPGAGQKIDGLWERRFYEDAPPAGAAWMRMLAQPSLLPKAIEQAESAGAMLFALFVYKGLLLTAAGDEGKLAAMKVALSAEPLTYALDAS